MTKVSDLVKEQLNEGENSSGEVIGVYKPLTQLIASNPSAYGQVNPIKPKIAGEPYNLQWSGGFFKSIKSQVEGLDINTSGQSEFLDGRDESKILGLQDENKKEIDAGVEENAVQNILDSIFE